MKFIKNLLFFSITFFVGGILGIIFSYLTVVYTLTMELLPLFLVLLAFSIVYILIIKNQKISNLIDKNEKKINIYLIVISIIFVLGFYIVDLNDELEKTKMSILNENTINKTVLEQFNKMNYEEKNYIPLNFQTTINKNSFYLLQKILSGSCLNLYISSIYKMDMANYITNDLNSVLTNSPNLWNTNQQ